MDTVEELNGTYFYAGKSNLTAAEMFFMVFCEKTIEQFGLGVADFGAVIGIVSGRNVLTTRTKPGGTILGTSYASKASRAVFKKAKFPFGMKLPTWLGGYTPWTVKRRMVRKMGTWVGPTIPLMGEVISVAAVSQIIYNTIIEYNTIARGNDKIW